jgi:hypothetical protein
MLKKVPDFLGHDARCYKHDLVFRRSADSTFSLMHHPIRKSVICAGLTVVVRIPREPQSCLRGRSNPLEGTSKASKPAVFSPKRQYSAVSASNDRHNTAAVHHFKPKLDCISKENYLVIQSLPTTSKNVSLYDVKNKNYMVDTTQNAHGVDHAPLNHAAQALIIYERAPRGAADRIMHAPYAPPVAYISRRARGAAPT